MRIVLDPVPLVLGIYAFAGGLLARAVEKKEDEDAESLGRRLSRQRGQSGDKELQRMVRTLHGDVKTVDKLLKKTADVWKISRETDLVELVIQPRGGEDDPRAYVLLRPKEIQPILLTIAAAARGAGESAEIVAQLEAAAAEMAGRPADYLAFGFDPWTG